MKSWKTTTFGTIYLMIFELQWSHDYEVVENATSTR